MDEDSIERIRSATFPIARKGYDKRQVERFLSGLADWLEGGGSDQALSEVIKRELERVGEKTGGILGAAHEAAEEIQVETEEEAGRTIEEARREEMRIRSLIEDYQAETRGGGRSICGAEAPGSRPLLEQDPRAGRSLLRGGDRRGRWVFNEDPRRGGRIHGAGPGQSRA